MRTVELNLGLDKVIEALKKREKKKNEIPLAVNTPGSLQNDTGTAIQIFYVFEMNPTNPYVSNTTRCIKNLTGTHIASLGYLCYLERQ